MPLLLLSSILLWLQIPSRLVPSSLSPQPVLIALLLPPYPVPTASSWHRGRLESWLNRPALQPGPSPCPFAPRSGVFVSPDPPSGVAASSGSFRLPLEAG